MSPINERMCGDCAFGDWRYERKGKRVQVGNVSCNDEIFCRSMNRWVNVTFTCSNFVDDNSAATNDIRRRLNWNSLPKP